MLNSSHRSLSRLYEISTREIDYLVDRSLGVSGLSGGRIMGGGFGGATINLISNEFKSTALKNIKKQYLSLTGLECGIHEIRLEDGVGMV